MTSITYRDFYTQIIEVLLEQLDDVPAGGFTTGNFDTFRRTSSNINHLFKRWMIKGLDRLHVHIRLADRRGVQEAYLIRRDKPFNRSLSKKGIGVGDKYFPRW